MSKLGQAFLEIQELTGKTSEEVTNDNLHFLQTASDRMMDALEEQEAFDAMHQADIAQHVTEASDELIKSEYEKRFN